MRIVLNTGDVLDLSSGDVLSVYEIDGGAVTGSGQMNVCCAVSSAVIDPNVTIVCMAPFKAEAVSFKQIDVTVPSDRSVDIRRKIQGEDNWVTIASSVTGGVYHDTQSSENAMIPGSVYLYQWADSGSSVWSPSDQAWLTQTFNRKVIAAEYRTDADEHSPDETKSFCAIWKIIAKEIKG